MKCSEMLHILDDNLIELLQKHINVLTAALDKVSNYNLRLEESNKSFVSALQKAEAYNVQLENDRDALATQNIKMMQSILYCTIYLDDNKLNSIATGSKAHTMLADAITVTPSQCLAEIKADTVLKFAGTVLVKYRYDITEWAKEYADKVRQGGE